MKLKDLPSDAIVDDYKLAIPTEGIKQLTDEPLTEGYLVSFHAKPGGWFMSPDPPTSAVRKLIPTYGDPRGILEWDIIQEEGNHDPHISEDGHWPGPPFHP